jgi:hypothetical protein
VAEPFGTKLKRLVAEQRTSIARVYDEAPWNGDGPKPSKASLDQALTGRRPLRREVIELMAAGLGVPPETFDEYRLAQLRAMIDPDVVGFERAVENMVALGGGDIAADTPDQEAARAELGAALQAAARQADEPRRSAPRTRRARRAPDGR